nr:hypothetical protein [Tanacetum cinerariifolium]
MYYVFSTNWNVKDDNKRSRTGNAFATTTNPMRREYTGTTPKCTNCNMYHLPESPCRACFSCNRIGHLAKDYKVVPRMVNPMNVRNPTVARGACFECGGTDHFKAACHGNNGNRACGGVFTLEAEEARQDPNIMTGIESSDLRFSYEIEIASGVIGKRPEEKVRHLRSAKTKEQKKEDIFMVRNFLEAQGTTRQGFHSTKLIALRSTETVRRKGIAMATPDLNGTHTVSCLSNLHPAEPITNDNIKIEISKELLTELRNNAYNGAKANDAVDHITRFLEIIDLVKIPNVTLNNYASLRFHTLSPEKHLGGGCTKEMTRLLNG